MAKAQKTHLIINPLQFKSLYGVLNRTFFPAYNATILNTGKVGTLWGANVYVSQVRPGKRKYTKLIGIYFLYKSIRYEVVHRHKNIYVCDNGKAPFKEFTYYKLKKILERQ